MSGRSGVDGFIHLCLFVRDLGVCCVEAVTASWMFVRNGQIKRPTRRAVSSRPQSQPARCVIAPILPVHMSFPSAQHHQVQTGPCPYYPHLLLPSAAFPSSGIIQQPQLSSPTSVPPPSTMRFVPKPQPPIDPDPDIDPDANQDADSDTEPPSSPGAATPPRSPPPTVAPAGTFHPVPPHLPSAASMLSTAGPILFTITHKRFVPMLLPPATCLPTLLLSDTKIHLGYPPLTPIVSVPPTPRFFCLVLYVLQTSREAVGAPEM